MMKDYRIMFFFFFFQAEDGIRDLYVTGVQTCALPIWRARVRHDPRRRSLCDRCVRNRSRCGGNAARGSEERRVGKECRYRWWPYHKKKKKKEKRKKKKKKKKKKKRKKKRREKKKK